MPYYGFDIYYLILVLPTVIFALIAQASVKSTVNKYSQVPTRRGMTGKQVAEAILQGAGIFDVSVEPVAGTLTDHYDPSAKVVRLSETVYNSYSIAACGIAAHECGHAIQHNVGYGPLSIRNAIIPITRIGSNLSMPLILAGILMGQFTSGGGTSDFGYTLIMLGIAAFGLSVVFQVITLPVEFNASSRALGILSNSMMLDQDELTGARKVLTAAAMTYVAAMAQALANMIRLLMLFGRGSRRRN